MLAVDHHDDAARVQVRHQGLGDLGGQSFLDLGTAGVDVDQPGQLGQTGHLAVGAGDVADVGDPGERHEVVLAHRPDLDVLDQDQFAVVDVEGRRQHLAAGPAHAREHFAVHPGDPFRGLEQTLAIRVLTDTDQDLADGSGDPLVVEVALRAAPGLRVRGGVTVSHASHPTGHRSPAGRSAGRSGIRSARCRRRCAPGRPRGRAGRRAPAAARDRWTGPAGPVRRGPAAVPSAASARASSGPPGPR
ncbi:hypothetical protein SDC9_78497 [bioreactor metagenome]|uniref:Uncharacterized protein n=1 Tax=bioreactor metagenome TaxID=1076179 RepID=A0A644YTN0_9ZZZZ